MAVSERRAPLTAAAAGGASNGNANGSNQPPQQLVKPSVGSTVEEWEAPGAQPPAEDWEVAAPLPPPKRGINWNNWRFAALMVLLPALSYGGFVLLQRFGEILQCPKRYVAVRMLCTQPFFSCCREQHSCIAELPQAC